MNELFKLFHILMAPPKDDGASSSQEEEVLNNNDDISKLTKSIAGGGSDEDDPKGSAKSRHIGYFDEDDEDDDDPGTDDTDEDEDLDTDDDLDEDKDQDDDEDLDLDDEGDDTDEDDDDPHKDKFYVPERDAKDRDPYPNEFETRADAVFALPAKVDTFDKLVAELEEAGSSLGAAIDPEIAEKIEKHRDLDYTNEMADDDLKADIVDIDEALKAVKGKVDRVKTTTDKVKVSEELKKKYEKINLEAGESSKALGIPAKLKDLPENPTKEDLMQIADGQISEKLSAIDEKIKNHQNDEAYLEENGLAKYNERLSELQEERRTEATKLAKHKETIGEWWDTQEEYRSTQEKAREMSPAEKAKKIDSAFLEFQEDRSQGPNALDIFTKAKDTAPIVHFRQYALKNSDQFDLTTPGGWVKAHSAWQGWVKENVQQRKTTSRKKKNTKKRKSIKPPSKSANRQQHVPSGDRFNDLQDTNADIGKLSRKIMGN